MRTRSVEILYLALLLTVACLGFLPGGARAQEFRSSLTGQVTDPSGAAVPGAVVTVTNETTHQSYTAKTNSTGLYYIPYVLPANYTVTVKAQGFKTAVQANVLIVAAESRALNFRLQVGAPTQSVTVTAAPPLLRTSSGSGGTIISERAVQNLPLDGRQVYMLIETTPGSQFTQETFGSSGFSGTRGWDVNNEYTIGGGLVGYNLFTLNGSNITMMGGYGDEGSWEVAPNVDAVQEVNVMTNPYDARYGQTNGGIVNIVTRAGTNQFHGDLYDYMENGKLNANNFENNLNGIPRQNVHQEQYGGTFGGPLIHNRAFFFGSFEGYWENIPFTTITSVPPAYLRPQSGQGVNFTPSGYDVFDPATTVCNSPGGTIGNCPNNNYSRTEFPNDTIPASRINPIGAAILNLFPLPNINTNSMVNNYIANVPDKYRYYQPMARVDWITSDRTRWYSTFEDQWGTEFRDVSGFTGPAENGNINTRRANIVATTDMTHTFSPNMVGDFKLSYSRFWDSFPDGPLSTPTPASIGLTGFQHAPTTTKDLLPEFYFSELYPQVVGNSTSNEVQQNLAFNADFTKVHGSQTFEFGGAIGEYNWANPFSVGHPNGDFTFGTQYTEYNPTNRGQLPPGMSGTSGNVIADLLLGYPDSGGVDWNDTIYEGFPMFSIYGQDNWRVTNRLTLNIGVRYDVERGLRERYNRLNRGMCFTCVNPITNNATYQANITNASNIAAWNAATQAIYTAMGVTSGPAIKPGTVYGGLLFPGVNGQSRDAYNTDWSNIQPRLGFAYSLNNKTVIRGGWGYMFSYGIEAGTTDGFSITTGYTSSLNGITPTNYFASGDPFPNGLQKPVGASLGLETALGNTALIDFPQRKIPRSMIMSLGIERELPAHMMLSVKYAGNYARAVRAYGGISSFGYWENLLPRSFGYDQCLQNTYFQDNCAAISSALGAQVPNPYYGVLPITSGMGSSPTVSAENLLVSLSEFGLVGDWTMPNGKTWFDSLQVKLGKRLYGATRGLSLQLAYTYSKDLELSHYTNGWPWIDPRPLYEPVPYDRTQIFTLTGVWDLPFGRGAKYILPHPSAPVGALINNWRMSWIFSDATGFPESFPQCTGCYWLKTNSIVPAGGPTFKEWLNNCNGVPLNCYSPTPSGGLAVEPDQVGYLRQPYIPNLDFTLEKDVHFSESKLLEIRADAFNMMNTPLFPGPDTWIFDGGPVQQANGSWSGFGTVPFNQQNFPRRVQLSLKLKF